MMTDEQQEIGMWAGGAVVASLVLWWFASSFGERVTAANAVIDKQLPIYETYYSTAAGRLPVKQASERVTSARQEQLQALTDAEGKLLAELDPKVRLAMRQTPTSAPSFGYNLIVDDVDSRYRDLKSKAVRLNAGALTGLPHEGADRIIRGDDAAAEMQRSVQLAQVVAVQRVLNFILDRNPSAVANVQAAAITTDRPVNPNYAVIGVTFMASFDYATTDRIMRELQASESRLTLSALSLTPDPRGDDRFTVEATISLVVPWPTGWDPVAILTSRNDAAPTPTRGAATTLRGRGN